MSSYAFLADSKCGLFGLLSFTSKEFLEKSKYPTVIKADNLASGKGVYICKNNNLSRIAFTNRAASLGKIYSRVTALLGFKPWEHEYKIMGMGIHPEESHLYFSFY